MNWNILGTVAVIDPDLIKLVNAGDDVFLFFFYFFF